MYNNQPLVGTISLAKYEYDISAQQVLIDAQTATDKKFTAFSEVEEKLKSPFIIELEKELNVFKVKVNNLKHGVINGFDYGDQMYNEVSHFLRRLKLHIKDAIDSKEDNGLLNRLREMNKENYYLGCEHYFWVFCKDPFAMRDFRHKLRTIETEAENNKYMLYNITDRTRKNRVAKLHQSTKKILTRQHEKIARYDTILEEKISKIADEKTSIALQAQLRLEQDFNEKLNILGDSLNEEKVSNRKLGEKFEELEKKMSTVVNYLDAYQQYDEDIDSLECPITKMEMVDPVIAEDSHTYERRAIQEWFANHDISPITGQRIGEGLRTNWAVRRVIDELSTRRNSVERNVSVITNQYRMFTRRLDQQEQAQEPANTIANDFIIANR
jgi:hypothetical protein